MVGSVHEAVADIHDGASNMIGGFAEAADWTGPVA
jgi:acyl CoA:acetate/3-ketoacid CoA transferase alpha subunit